MGRKKIYLAFAAVLILTAGLLVFATNQHSVIETANKSGTASQAAEERVADTPEKTTIDHIVIILEENRPESAILNNPNAPYINKLATTYAYTANYSAVTNPSLPNYLALTSGSTNGIDSDCNPPSASCDADVPNIADRLEQAGKSWKFYGESMPAACYSRNSGEYAVKHNPFVYYAGIRGDQSRCNAHVIPYDPFLTDLRSASTLPDYSFIAPNMCNDMHNCTIQTGDSWLAREVPRILASPAFTRQNSLLAIVWDEGYKSDNRVIAIFAGPAAKRGYVSNAKYDHYSLLHTIESVWHLPPLTQNDANAPVMTDMLSH